MSFRLTGGAGLRSMLAKAQALATGALSKRLAPRIAGDTIVKLGERARSTATAPSGRKWPATKDGRALRWPAQASIRAEVQDGKIRLVVSGPSYLAPQHSGWRKVRSASTHEFLASMSSNASKGQTRKRWGSKPRRIAPKGAVPKPWVAVIAKALNVGWRSFMTSRGVRRAR